MHPRLRHLLLGLSLLAGLYVGLYLLPANLLLATSLGPRLASRHPERLRLDWSAAWSLWPGEVEIRRLQIAGHHARVRWSLAVDRGRGHLDLPALLRRELRIERFAGEGVEARVRREAAAPLPRVRPRRGPWTVRFEGIQLAGVRALEYGPLRLEGEGHAAGSFQMRGGRDLRLDLASLAMAGGRLLTGGETVAREVSLLAALRLGPYAPRQHPGAAAFDFLSGTLRAKGSMADLPALRRVAGPAAQTALRPGRLVFDLQVEKGRLLPGSRAELVSPGSPPLAASCAVVTEGTGPQLRLAADLPGFTLRRSGGRPPLLESDRLSVEAATPELRLSALFAAAHDLRGSGPLGWVLPGEAWAQGLRLRFPGRRTSLEITADRVRGKIDLPALLRREVRLEGVEAAGARLRVSRGTPLPPPPPGPRRVPWQVTLAGIRLAGTGDVDFAGLRLAGDLEAAGDLTWKDGALALERASMTLAAGRFERRGETAAQNVRLQADLRFGPFASRQARGANWLDSLSGTFHGTADVVAVPALRRTSGPAPDRRDPARLVFDAGLEHGELQPGSRAELSLRPDRRSPPMRVSGAVAAGEAPRLLWAADLPGFVILRKGAPPLLQSRELQVTLSTSERRLSRLIAPAQELLGSARVRVSRPLPGEVRAAGLRLAFPGSRISMNVHAAAGRGEIDIPSLFRKEVRLSGLTLAGAHVRFTEGTPPAPGAAPPGTRSSWSARFAGARLAGNCEVELGGYRFDGGLRAGGTLEWDGQELWLEHASLDLARGRLRHGEETMARALSLQAEGRVEPFVPGKVPGLEGMRLLSGRWQVGGDIASLGFLQPYLEKASWLNLDGSGTLRGDLRLDRGLLLPGSRFAVSPARLKAEYLLSRATGTADLTGTVVKKADGAELEMQAVFGRFEVAARGVPIAAPHIRGERFRLALSTRDLDLARKGKDFRIRLDLPAAEVADLAFYNTYLPVQAGVEIVSGSGRLSFWLEVETEGRSGKGEVTLTSDGVRLRLNDVELNGVLSLHAPLASADLRSATFALDGTRLTLDHVALREVGEETGPEPKGKTPSGWWARLELLQASMSWAQPLSVTGSVRLEMRDSGLLLSLFSRRRRYLEWFRRVLDVPGIAAQGELRLDQGAVVIGPLIATGKGVELRSRLRLSRERRRGFLFVRRGSLAVGLELDGDRRDYHFIHPRQWYDSRGDP